MRSNTSPKILLLLLAALPAMAMAQHHHEAHAPAAAAASAAAQPAPGERWATDANLREGMGRIRSTVDELRHHEMGHMGDERAALLATDVSRDIGWIVANCELAPDADAALHPIIGRLAADASALKANPGDITPIASMRDALADYARLFDDPGSAAASDD